ncbi:muts domain V-domain-containing protein [Lipomyces oligophaga]|uniref:muts domain V-domain-containing protein n=1 Tax=Lipomyces oligophaga TaxID=45792 RepID=UPI0034CE1C78
MAPQVESLFDDKNDENKFVTFYRTLDSSDPTLIKVFSHNNFYSVYGRDALYVAQNVFRTLTVIKYYGSSDPQKRLPGCTLSPAIFRNFLRDALLNLGLKIEIYASSGRQGFTLLKQASPGNLQAVEDDLSNSFDGGSPVVIAVRVSAKSDQKLVGVCFADATARELGVSEFVDNELFSNLESLIIQLGVKELLLQSDELKKDYDLKKIRGIADRCSIAITERRSAEFSPRDIEQDLTRLLSGEISASMLPQMSLKIAMGAAACLVKYLGLMSDASNFGQYRLYQHDLSQYMKLDSAAVRALNLMPGPRDGSKNMSIYGLLNRCKTTSGARLLGQWLKQPLMDLTEIEQRHSLVEALIDDIELHKNLQTIHLSAVPDLHKIAKKFQRGSAGLEDVVRAYQTVIRIPDLIESLQNIRTSKESNSELVDAVYTSKFSEFYAGLEKLVELVETTIDLDALERHEFIIKPEFDESLREADEKIKDIRMQIQEEHIVVADKLGMDADKKLKLENHTQYGWCMRLTRTDSSVIRGKREYIEHSIQKAGLYFSSPRMQELNLELRDLTSSYGRMQSGLVREVVAVAATYCGVLERMNALLAHLDVIASFAYVSMTAVTPYVRPRMYARGTGNTILKAARHPCIEAQDDAMFIPNDVELIRGSSEFLIITGPNMGGKSTYIRQIGVIALLAQAGCFVPCGSAELTVFDCILARVGAGDSPLKGVSTFMAEMLETSSILKSASADSLIIIDELGRGTSTYDGFGLAWAISQHIVREIKCFALFATHFHELTDLADKLPQVQNLHVVAHIQDVQQAIKNRDQLSGKEITLLYKVEQGVCNQSFGIHVAELVRFPEKVINMAKRKASELEDLDNHDLETKCTKAQVAEGGKLLYQILKEWRMQAKQVQDKSKLLDVFKQVIDSPENKMKLENDAFVQEVLTL